jgi:hypothetical protein
MKGWLAPIHVTHLILKPGADAIPKKCHIQPQFRNLFMQPLQLGPLPNPLSP